MRCVDVHAHIVPAGLLDGPGALDPSLAEWREVAGRRRLFTRGRELASVVGEMVDPALMAAEAARDGVDHLLLSPWARLAPLGLPAGEARQRCEQVNEPLAGVVASDPALFSALGVVPVEHPAEAVAALRAAMGSGLAGVELAAEGGGFLGDESLEPLWAAAEELSAIVFVHPSTRAIALGALDHHYLWNTVGNPAETAIAAARLATGGVLERHPDLCVVLAHGGGALPALVGRLRHGQRAVPAAAGRLSDPIERSIARFHYDTITHDPTLLRRLVDDYGAERVLLGSDRPFDMGDPDPVGSVRALGLDAADETAVLGDNAVRLLGLKARTVAEEISVSKKGVVTQ
ncbi:MAG: amidohydrolase family protein [Acidimicrobiales bacterium]